MKEKETSGSLISLRVLKKISVANWLHVEEEELENGETMEWST